MRPHVSEAQIRQIYADTIDALYGYASRKCGGDRALAEDVTQETWLRAIRDWPHKGVPDNPLAWLTAVARNLLLNHLRKHESVSLEAVSPREILDAVENDTVTESAEIAAAVRGAVDRMPTGQAQLLEAFHYKRERVAQIAANLGLSERAIEGRLRRARETLRRELELTLKTEGDWS